MQSVVATHREFFPDDSRSDGQIARLHQELAQNEKRMRALRKIHESAGTSDQECLCRARRYMLNVLNWNAGQIVAFMVKVLDGSEHETRQLREIVQQANA